MQAQPVVMPTKVKVQIILDSVQAKYPGNEWVKKCSPDNHGSTCYDPSIPHLIYHIYMTQEHCEDGEGVSCVDFNSLWIPIGKPVVEEIKP